MHDTVLHNLTVRKLQYVHAYNSKQEHVFLQMRDMDEEGI